jgi:hypothetical protein
MTSPPPRVGQSPEGGGRVLTGVSGSFTASHVCGEPEAHEHTWRVIAWFETPARADARCYQAMLGSMLASWNGKPLPANMEWGEDIARTIGKLVNCVEVVVSREPEGIYARWLA